MLLSPLSPCFAKILYAVDNYVPGKLSSDIAPQQVATHMLADARGNGKNYWASAEGKAF